MKNLQKPRKSKRCTTFEAEILIIEIKFYKGAKRLRGERETTRIRRHLAYFMSLKAKVQKG